MRRLPIFPIYRRFHFVAADAKVEPVTRFHRGIETAPENDADSHEKQCRDHAGPFAACGEILSKFLHCGATGHMFAALLRSARAYKVAMYSASAFISSSLTRCITPFIAALNPLARAPLLMSFICCSE